MHNIGEESESLIKPPEVECLSLKVHNEELSQKTDSSVDDSFSLQNVSIHELMSSTVLFHLCVQFQSCDVAVDSQSVCNQSSYYSYVKLMIMTCLRKYSHTECIKRPTSQTTIRLKCFNIFRCSCIFKPDVEDLGYYLTDFC